MAARPFCSDLARFVQEDVEEVVLLEAGSVVGAAVPSGRRLITAARLLRAAAAAPLSSSDTAAAAAWPMGPAGCSASTAWVAICVDLAVTLIARFSRGPRCAGLERKPVGQAATGACAAGGLIRPISGLSSPRSASNTNSFLASAGW